jgi:flagellar assembly factor FliW
MMNVIDSPRLINSPHLGDIEWTADSELFLPSGLPGFEAERRMIPVEVPAQRPFVFLQSLEKPETCFVALPATVVSPAYQPHISEDDRHALLLEFDSEPALGQDILCLVLLVPAGTTVQANLDAPVVINLHNRRCIQAHSPESTAAGCYRLSATGAWEALC